MHFIPSFFSFVFLFSLFSSCSKEDEKIYIRISERNPNYFEYSDGKPYIPIGPNICWERFEKDETKVIELYEQRFRNLSENGGNYTRIWLSAPFFDVEHSKAASYDQNVKKRIDKILALAEKYDIKIKFCLENFRALEDYPAIFPGSVPFDKPIYSKKYGGPLESTEDYFNTPEGKELFTQKLAFYSKYYKDNPAIFGWELWNEINAVHIPDKPESVLKWTNTMLPLSKTYFPNHLVMQSLGSFDRKSSFNLYEQFVTLLSNEIAQVHRYLDPGASWEICQAPMDILASNAVRELQNMVENKPIVLSEVGAVEANHSGPSLLYQKDNLGVLLHDMLFAPFFSGAAGPGQSWHWQFYIEKNNLWWHFGRFEKAIRGINPIIENFIPQFCEIDGVRLYVLKGKSNILIWGRDSKSDWVTEIVEGKNPEKRNLNIPLSKLLISDKQYNVKMYDPWNDLWSKIKIENNGLTIPQFERSFVIRIENE